MKVKLNYKGKEIVAEIADEDLEKLVEEPKKKTGWEKVKNDEIQHYITSYGDVKADIRNDAYPLDTKRDKVSNNFNSEELAENIARARALHDNILRRSIELCDKVDWNDHNQKKYFISYIHAVEEIRVYFTFGIRGVSEIYFDTREHAQQVVE